MPRYVYGLILPGGLSAGRLAHPGGGPGRGKQISIQVILALDLPFQPKRLCVVGGLMCKLLPKTIKQAAQLHELDSAAGKAKAPKRKLMKVYLNPTLRVQGPK